MRRKWGPPDHQGSTKFYTRGCAARVRPGRIGRGAYGEMRASKWYWSTKRTRDGSLLEGEAATRAKARRAALKALAKSCPRKP